MRQLRAARSQCTKRWLERCSIPWEIWLASWMICVTDSCGGRGFLFPAPKDRELFPSLPPPRVARRNCLRSPCDQENALNSEWQLPDDICKSSLRNHQQFTSSKNIMLLWNQKVYHHFTEIHHWTLPRTSSVHSTFLDLSSLRTIIAFITTRMDIYILAYSSWKMYYLYRKRSNSDMNGIF